MPACLSCNYHIDAGSLCSDCAGRAIISKADWTVLKMLLDQPPHLSPLIRSAISEKLDGAAVVMEADVPENIVTINSRVRYRVEDGPPEIRTLVGGDEAYVPGHSLPVTTPAGICLLGLAEGDTAPLPSMGGPLRALTVVELIWQPEAAHRSFFRVVPPGADWEGVRRTLGAETGQWPGRVIGSRMPPNDDNPGPRAA